MKRIALILAISVSAAAFAAENAVPEVAPENLETYRFEHRQPEAPPEIRDLSPSQTSFMNRQRQDVKNLIARHLGIMALHADRTDLDTIQQIYNRKILRNDQVKDWQAVGVVFGDILVKEFGLHWVSYSDDRGVSRVLQWKNTRNFIFPVTVFSKRIRFGEKVDARGIYDKIKDDIEGFKAHHDLLANG